MSVEYRVRTPPLVALFPEQLMGKLRALRLLAVVTFVASPFAVQAQAGPQVYEPGTFSTGAWDFFVALTPDQHTAYICRANGDFSYYTILETDFADGRWSEPRAAAFSGRWSDADPHLSPDGSKLFFISNRPLTGDTPRGAYDIWVVEQRAGGRWGAPRNLGAPVNRDSVTEWSPSVARNGNLYFGTIRNEGRGGNDLYVARWTGDRYAEPENLGDYGQQQGRRVRALDRAGRELPHFQCPGPAGGPRRVRPLRERAPQRDLAASPAHRPGEFSQG
jgi:hypothetical protein